MAGKIKNIIDKIIEERSQGNDLVAKATKVKLKLKGINVDLYDNSSADDVEVIAKLEQIAKELNVSL
ncbi:MAG: hypothetical protein ACOCP8_00620 [archaeon]